MKTTWQAAGMTYSEFTKLPLDARMRLAKKYGTNKQFAKAMAKKPDDPETLIEAYLIDHAEWEAIYYKYPHARGIR